MQLGTSDACKNIEALGAKGATLCLLFKRTLCNKVMWNSILAGHVQMGAVEEASLVFDQMPVLLGRSWRVSDARNLFDCKAAEMAFDGVQEDGVVVVSVLLSVVKEAEFD